VLEALELPTSLPADLDLQQTLAGLNLDKKRANGVVRWVLPSAIGTAFVDTHVPPGLVQEVLVEWLGQAQPG
jgi:3-dehydroquinate synthase